MAAQSARHYIPHDSEDNGELGGLNNTASVDDANDFSSPAMNHPRYTLFDQQRTNRLPSQNARHNARNRSGHQPAFHDKSSGLGSHSTGTSNGQRTVESHSHPQSRNYSQALGVGAPDPILSDTEVESMRNGIETSSDSGGDEQGINEEEAPAPVQETDRSGSWRREDTLESREEESHYKSKKSSFATKLYMASYLIFFSIWGTLARIGVQWLTFYPGAPVVISNLWANVAGTLVMGFLSEDQKLFRDAWGRGKKSQSRDDKKELSDEEKTARKATHGKLKKTIPVYVGLTVGFCGSFTSFSTFMRDAFFALANEVATPNNHPGDDAAKSATITRNKGYSFTALIAVIFLTLGMSFAAFYLGAHIALATQDVAPVLPFRFLRKILDRFMVFLGFGCWLGAIFMTIWPPDRRGGPVGLAAGVLEHWRSEALFACCFAPIGCLLRYYASIKLNGLVPWFPVGTFAVNMFGTAILGMCYDLQHVDIGGTVGGSLLGCQALQGLEDGFCGSLSTVSTWIVELSSLRRQHAYLYGTTSVAVGFCLLVAIMGSVTWSIGFSTAICKIETS